MSLARSSYSMNRPSGACASCTVRRRMNHAPRLHTLTTWGAAALLLFATGALWPSPLHADNAAAGSGRAKIDFNEVDFPVFVKFMSDLTHKNFVIDDMVKKSIGKITLYSPDMVTVDQAYNMFMATLAVNRLTTVPMGNIIQIVQLADVPPERGIFVYKLQHANAGEVAAILTTLATKAQTTPQIPGARPLLRPAGEFDGPIQVLADKATNSVVVTATKLSYAKLQSVLRSLDTPRHQVFVEAVILEVSVDRLRQIGTDPAQVIAAGERGSVRGVGGVNRAPEDLAALAQTIGGTAAGASSGGALTVLNTVNVRAFLNFLMNLSDTNILSTPQVMASDNQKAKMVVGENRPFPTGQAQGITGGTLVTIERKDVGVTLELTPQVLDNDLIRMEIKQEITAISENVAQTIGSGSATVPVGPTTTKRAMETTTIAHDQQTVVIGGLVRDNLSISESKIPLLGDIPLLGWLFKSQTRQTEKLSLLVFLTPHILKDERDVAKLNERKAGELLMLQRENRIEESTRLKQEVFERLTPSPPAPRKEPSP